MKEQSAELNFHQLKELKGAVNRVFSKNGSAPSRFARHSDPSTTMTYINTRKDELYKAVDEAFSIEKAEKLKARVTPSY